MEKQRESYDEALVKRLSDSEVLDYLRKAVRFFPGSIDEYQRMVGYEVKPIDLDQRDVGVQFLVGFQLLDLGQKAKAEIYFQCLEPLDLQRKLLVQGIEALVNCVMIPRQADSKYDPPHLVLRYGLPVALSRHRH